MNEFLNFSIQEGNLLVRLILAHLLSDFVFQTRAMVQNKKWNSLGLLAHIAVTILTAFILSGNIWIVLIIGITHYLIDISKTLLTEKYPEKSFVLFIIDQIAHVAVLVLVWAGYLGKFQELWNFFQNLIHNYNVSLALTGYVFCIWPSAYIVKFAVQKLLQSQTSGQEETERIQHGGKWIGQFERLLIFTFVLLSEYSAIGFLITGKSIIRFADKDQLKSEYVLVGTLLSYCLAIFSGILVKWMLQ
jgi:hypothetical protein